MRLSIQSRRFIRSGLLVLLGAFIAACSGPLWQRSEGKVVERTDYETTPFDYYIVVNKRCTERWIEGRKVSEECESSPRGIADKNKTMIWPDGATDKPVAQADSWQAIASNRIAISITNADVRRNGIYLVDITSGQMNKTDYHAVFPLRATGTALSAALFSKNGADLMLRDGTLFHHYDDAKAWPQYVESSGKASDCYNAAIFAALPLEAQPIPGWEEVAVPGGESLGDGCMGLNRRAFIVRRGDRWHALDPNTLAQIPGIAEASIEEAWELAQSMYELRNKTRSR